MGESHRPRRERNALIMAQGWGGEEGTRQVLKLSIELSIST